MGLLSKDQIAAADDRQWEDVPVPEWGGEVRILGMSGTERNAYQSSLVVIGTNGKPQRVNLTDQLAKLVGKCLVGEDFERLYTDKEVAELGRKNGAVLDRLAAIAKRLSGLDEKATEDAAGNSEAGPSAGSTSD
ncbi:hypothetical protein K388_01934 [Streptomyces sp. KhCrAH-43]|uniref:hypothetical protein n=1 Tax=unclassified Streptomyces TaxID=2593676 RepID=UPI00035CA5EE|nr:MULTISPECIES: hypothetical protein [unclassified Streptomyces]MYS34934.1 hypothetical protein [Streptomyces sp. SID4920]MYX65289.1 hypothetical protein [Streptomyces sp. SID8373]RAJ64739.1 hypothetical protein K388_01934 [Streptomyces sp. KhCrAH-43]